MSGYRYGIPMRPRPRPVLEFDWDLADAARARLRDLEVKRGELEEEIATMRRILEAAERGKND